jgi:ketosteroid isomerase-like protein
MDDNPNSLSQRVLDSFLAHDAVAICENYADDAILYAPNGEVAHGKEACRQAFDAMFDTFEVVAFNWDDYGTQVGDYAYHWGSWKWTAKVRASGQEMVITARTTDVRHKGQDGRWRIVLDHASVPIPATAA